MTIRFDYLLHHLAREECTERSAEFAELYREVYAEPPYYEGEEHVAAFLERFADELRSLGFSLVAAETDGELVGYAYGLSFEPDQWWDDSDPQPAELRGYPKFAVMEFVVRKQHRGKGIGRALISALLTDRTEPFATLCANPAAPAHQIYRHWGWRLVGRAHPPDIATMDILLRPLRSDDARLRPRLL